MHDDPSINPLDQSGGPADTLLFDCLSATPGDLADRLAALRRESPAHAAEVERRLRLLGEFGFLDTVAEPRQPGMPAKIGAFEPLRVLGQGGMGTVYLAEQPELGRKVALKVIHHGLVHAPRVRERFRREEMAASRLDHPAICPIYEVGESEGTAYLAMRYVAGPTLAECIRRARESAAPGLQLPGQASATKPASVDRVLHLVEKLARALHAAHSARLVHRDVKPDNVLLDAAGEPVLVDFQRRS